MVDHNPVDEPIRIISDLHLGHTASLAREIAQVEPLFRDVRTLIFNGDTVAGNLDNCVLNIYFAPNSTVGNAIDLAGTLDPGGTYVVCDDGYAGAGCDLPSAGNFWNGDDTIELVCGVTTLDVFGQIGDDPGDEWNVGGVGTQNETLRRDCAVTTGDSDGSDAFDPSAEWDTFAIDTFDGLGTYDCP